jgi:DNA-binding GntR family transcriptional regulator
MSGDRERTRLTAAVKPEVWNGVESDRVYALLRNSLVQCKFRPSDFFSEVQLARQCKTSRTPIREAGNLPAQEGWISRIPHRGYVVPPISIREMLGEIAGNQRILQQLTLTLEYVRRLDILSTQKDEKWVPHEEILAALEAHNSSRAGKAMAVHIDSSCDRMLKVFGT